VVSPNTLATTKNSTPSPTSTASDGQFRFQCAVGSTEDSVISRMETGKAMRRPGWLSWISVPSSRAATPTSTQLT
jgi:hypothetical protein